MEGTNANSIRSRIFESFGEKSPSERGGQLPERSDAAANFLRGFGRGGWNFLLLILTVVQFLLALFLGLDHRLLFDRLRGGRLRLQRGRMRLSGSTLGFVRTYVVRKNTWFLEKNSRETHGCRRGWFPSDVYPPTRRQQPSEPAGSGPGRRRGRRSRRLLLVIVLLLCRSHRRYQTAADQSANENCAFLRNRKANATESFKHQLNIFFTDSDRYENPNVIIVT